MKLVVQCLAVGAAGFFGAIARLLIGMACGRAFSQFPVGTLVINLSGRGDKDVNQVGKLLGVKLF